MEWLASEAKFKAVGSGRKLVSRSEFAFDDDSTRRIENDESVGLPKRSLLEGRHQRGCVIRLGEGRVPGLGQCSESLE